MNSLTTKNTLHEAPTELEALLMAFLRYGNVRLSFIDDGWHCNIGMHVASQGATFTIASGFKCQTPMAAALECWERMSKTLKDLNS